MPPTGSSVDALPDRCDLLVAGSGAAGLSAAVTAALLGLRVVVVEKAPVFGGTTAWSGGWMWIPGNPLAAEAGIADPADAPRCYLQHELGPTFDAAKVDAFLAHGPRMVQFFLAHTALRFVGGAAIPDFHEGSPGAGRGGRSLCAAPFDGRALGEAIHRLRPPLDLIAPGGMGIAAGADLAHFLDATRSFAALRHVAGRVLRHGADRLRHGRGMHLVNGNALVARLLRSALDAGVELHAGIAMRRLIVEHGRVAGAEVAGPDGRGIEIRAARGVVLACGGFPHDAERKRALIAHASTADGHVSAAPPEGTGDGLRLGESAGGFVDPAIAAPAAWVPVSLVPRADGRAAAFPHLIDRAKPGLIAVDRRGRRFANEADAYHDVVARLLAATPPCTSPEAWLLCDHRFLRRYGLGAVRPSPLPFGSHLRSGYLRRGRTIAALAAACGLPARALAETVEIYNRSARDGQDPEFGRGSTAFNRVQGDPAQRPNPCVAPIERGPYYAVRVQPGSLGTFAGLATDADGRVLGRDGRPVPGLYANGNDMSPVMGGHYPAGGITLGPAMTFGYLLAHHAAGRPPPGAAGAADGAAAAPASDPILEGSFR